MIRVTEAVHFAALKHKDQRRKYTDDPYINHPIEVAKIVSEVKHTDEMLCAAYLHDTIEDTDTTYNEILKTFGLTVATYVLGLTDISKLTDGNRATRKKMDREHLSEQYAEVQTIKLADLISNTTDILKHDIKFAKTYLKEAQKLYKALDKGDTNLRYRLLVILNNSESKEVANG